MDQEQGWALVYELIVSAGLTLFIYLSFPIFRRPGRRLIRIFYGAWAGIQTLTLVFNFAVLVGAASTIEPYPIVAFSNVEQLVGRNVLPVLIGSDDKMFALLLVNVGSKKENALSKTILYLPRSEVKWMTVIRTLPIHLVSHANELMDLQRSPSQQNIR